MDRKNYILKLISQRNVLKQYIAAKLESDDDYHAIADAAMDIREIDAQLKALDQKWETECHAQKSTT